MVLGLAIAVVALALYSIVITAVLVQVRKFHKQEISDIEYKEAMKHVGSGRDMWKTQ